MKRVGSNRLVANLSDLYVVPLHNLVDPAVIHFFAVIVLPVNSNVNIRR